jgi:hypothetical protein
MLYYGAKGTMTPNIIAADGAAAPSLNRNVSLPDSGHSRPAGKVVRTHWRSPPWP